MVLRVTTQNRSTRPCCDSSSIRHLAVIDRLELEFEPGLNVLTGETGAGKSILVGAVGLLVGGRASADLVRTGEESAAVEAIFDTPDGREMIVRREISAQGRSRASVDGALTTSSALRDLCGGLVDLHGQHEHQVLLDPATHLDLLDEFARRFGRARAPSPMRSRRWQQVQGRARAPADAASARRPRAPSSCRSSSPRSIASIRNPARTRSSPRRRRCSANADKLQRLCGDAYDALYEGDQAALPALGHRLAQGWRTSRASTRGSVPYVEARDSVKSQLEDLAYFLRSYAADIDASPARLQEVEDRLAVLERLKKKHGPTLADVLARRDQLRRELHDIEHATERIAELDRALEAARASYLAAASVADGQAPAGRAWRSAGRSRSRSATWPWPARAARSDSTAADTDAQWTDRGVEQGEFYISPNPGRGPEAAGADRSGGELSRIMLALKTLASTDAPGQDAHLRRGGLPGSAVQSPTSSATASSGWADASRCSASRTCRRSPRTAARTSGSRRASRRGGR